MQRQPITGSSQIQEIGYDAETQTLEVQFHNGSVYDYDGCTGAEYDALRQSGSTKTLRTLACYPRGKKVAG